MTSLGDLWKGLTGKEKVVPASQAIPRMRESSGVLPAIRPSGRQPVAGAKPPMGEPTPATAMPTVPPPRDEASGATSAPAAIMPPAWSEVFPGHYKALLADLVRRNEDPARWEVQDGRDMGVNENGHTVAFRMHKTDTSVTIHIELTLFKGKLAHVRVR